jgi:hypothetical protein
VTAPVPGRPIRALAAEWTGGGRLFVVLGGLAIVIAAFSLLIPSTPSYDPWSWLIWGREIVHFDLQTTGGPTWKPLPIIFTTLFAPFGRAAPDLWLVVARAGALMAVALTFKVALRLTRQLATKLSEVRDGGVAPWSPALLAAIIAAGSLVVSRGFISDNALGYSEGLMTALVLLSIDRHLDGHRRQAFAIGFFAALDRPELWAAWGPYGLYLWWKDPGARRLVLGLFVLIPVLWFLPEYWGSGHFFRGVNRAHHPRSNSPAFAKCPFCTELSDHAWPTVLLRVKVVTGIAMALAAFGLWRSRRAWWPGGRRGWFARIPGSAQAALLAIGAAGAAWWVLIAVLTQAGFSGNDRYLVLGAALVAIVGGVGWGWLAAAVASFARRFAGPVRRVSTPATAGATGALAAAAVFMALPPWIGANIVDVPATHRALVYQAHLREDVTAAVRRAGGARVLLRCGTVMTEGFQVPMVAYTLGVHTLRIEASPLPGQPLPPAPNVILQTRAQRHARLLPILGDWRGTNYHLLAHFRAYRIYSTCPKP